MDIDLLSKMVKELILDNDRVVLPGLGSFVAEIVPSTFSDRGYTINPPYRRLFFRSKPDKGEKLVKFYAESNNVELEIAERIIRDFVAELKSVLHTKKTIVFPGLGRLRATKENNVFFVADEDLDIYPAGFGLEPISLKTHQETPQEVAAVVESLKEIIDEPVEVPVEVQVEAPVEEPIDIVLEEEIIPTEWTETDAPAETDVPEEVETPSEVAEPEVVSEPEPEVVSEPDPEVVSEPEPEVVSEPDLEVVSEPVPEVVPEPVEEDITEPESEVLPEPEKKQRSGKAHKAVLITLASLVALLVIYVVVMRLFPDLFNGLLYTPEELEIINFR